jgi:hypothetical protein
MQAKFEQMSLNQELIRVNEEIARRGRFDNFYASLAQSFARYGSLTERQTAALKRSLTQYHDRNEQFAARRAAEAPVVTAPMPTGRVTVTGTVVSFKYVESQFGSQLKMLVLADQGWKVWGTCPSALRATNILKGARVTFSAEVQPKEEAFGFFSRPTQASFIDEAPAAQAAPAPAPVAAPVAQPEALEPGDDFQRLIAQQKAARLEADKRQLQELRAEDDRRERKEAYRQEAQAKGLSAIIAQLKARNSDGSSLGSDYATTSWGELT